MKKLYEYSATELSSLLRGKEVSAAEITEAALARIEAVEGRVDAFLTVTADEAREAAKQVDARIAAGDELAPLACIP